MSLYGTGRVTVDARIVNAVAALDACLRKWGYRTVYAQTGAFVCRQITNGVGYSLHAYGIAIDINWLRNGYGNRAGHDLPAGMVRDILAIRTNNGAQVWGWGGNYTTTKDWMHFEIVASPQEIATGIRTSTAQPEEFTVDTDAKKRFDSIDLRLDAIGNRLDVMEKDRLKPTTSRVRVILEHLGLRDPA